MHSDAPKIVVVERNMTTIDSLAHLSDEQLLTRVHTLADDERRTTVTLIAALAELDARRLYLRQGCSSLFTYCTQVLHLSEHAAYGRIEAARAARRFPILFDRLAEGALTLTSLSLLAPHLTEANHRDVLAAARHKTKREVELLVATLRPQPGVPAIVRKLRKPKAVAAPTARASDQNLSTANANTSVDSPSTRPAERCPWPVVKPLAPERYKLQVTLSADAHQKLRRAQDLLRHTVPTAGFSSFTMCCRMRMGDKASWRISSCAAARTMHMRQPDGTEHSSRESSARHRGTRSRTECENRICPRTGRTTPALPENGCAV